jgi:hypothetical protein
VVVVAVDQGDLDVLVPRQLLRAAKARESSTDDDHAVLAVG